MSSGCNHSLSLIDRVLHLIEIFCETIVREKCGMQEEMRSNFSPKRKKLNKTKQ